MKSFMARTMALCALVLLSFPTQAQRVRYDHNGQADVLAENLMLVETAVARDITGIPSGSMGQVVFFRSVRGNDDELPVTEDGQLLHALGQGGWFVALVPAGSHRYEIGGRELPLDIRPGRSYFVRIAGQGAGLRVSQSSAMVFLNATGSRPLPRL